MNEQDAKREHFRREAYPLYAPREKRNATKYCDVQRNFPRKKAFFFSIDHSMQKKRLYQPVYFVYNFLTALGRFLKTVKIIAYFFSVVNRMNKP